MSNGEFEQFCECAGRMGDAAALLLRRGVCICTLAVCGPIVDAVILVNKCIDCLRGTRPFMLREYGEDGWPHLPICDVGK